MDLKQRKLSRAEWESVEIPVSLSEIDILKLITSGYHDVTIKQNHNNSLFGFLKIEYSEKMEEYLYNKYFAEKIKKITVAYNIDFIKVKISPNIMIKSADKIRLSKTDSNIDTLQHIFEFVLLNQIELLFMNKQKNKNWLFNYFTIFKLMKNSIPKINKIIQLIIHQILEKYSDDVDLLHIICNSVEYIEKNSSLLKYGDITLYDHQKEIFTAVKSPKPKLILYIAPTGTGKTLTPLGLSENHKIIFVCAARHVGLALARAAISINKKIAFAFGCNSAEDIRLHYFSAKEYTVDRRSGGIRKVDNTVGDKVEIMICDIKSYLPAMYYMLAFNTAPDIITYWDEPTITLDYATHDFHPIIKMNWKDNLIPNFVLSSATLPKMHEITDTIIDFKDKFPEGVIINIVSHDCRKTIPLINNNGYVVMPHYLTKEYSKLFALAEHSENNLTLLRYFDLSETSNFIHYCETNNYIKAVSKIERNFGSIDDINMKSIKIHYLKVIKNIQPESWDKIYAYFMACRVRRIISNDTIDTKGNKLQKAPIGPGVTSNHLCKTEGTCGMYVTTKDAYTLTDGPTIFLAKDVHKIAKFCIQQANIPTSVMKDIMSKIEFNNDINEKIDTLEKEIEYELLKQETKEDNGASKDKKGKTKTKSSDNKTGKPKDKHMLQLQDQIDLCRSMIKQAALNDIFIPNKLAHINKWSEDAPQLKSFTSDIDDDAIVSIMLLKNVEDSWKILLLLGIGVFTNHESFQYTEIMKKMADKQKLYMIIADSDYIYGTNYQFCHGYLSKDMVLTQEKIIQAMGRIGRNNIQQEYSVRFRDDEQIHVLFKTFLPEEKPEVINMNLLFNSKN